MGVRGGPDPDELFHPNAKFFFDASNQIGNVSSTSFTNFVKSGEYTDWTIDNSNAIISGIGASKALITQSLQGFKNSLRATGTFNQRFSFSWSMVVAGGTTAQDNKMLRVNDSCQFLINANGTFTYSDSGEDNTSSALGLTSTVWKHLLFTRNNASCNLYVNNISSFSFTRVNNNSPTDSDFRFNSFPGSTVTVAYLFYWHDYTLSASEIQREYDKVKRRFSLP
jgi:hypothetical protein